MNGPIGRWLALAAIATYPLPSIAQEIDLTTLGLPLGNLECSLPLEQRRTVDCIVTNGDRVIDIRQSYSLGQIQLANPDLEISSDSQEMNAVIAIPKQAEADTLGGCAEGWTLPSVTPACKADPTSCDTMQRSTAGDVFIGEFFIFEPSPEAFLEKNGLPLDTPYNACLPAGDAGDDVMLKL